MDEQKRILKEKESECRNISTASPSNDSGTCKPTWDQILCWPETEPGENQILPCPGYFFGFDPKQNATRFCHDNGTWMQWSNYSECYDSLYATVTEPFTGALNDSTLAAYLPVVTDISRAGYSISLLSLLLAFSILASVRTLRCPRNILHMHLFASFIMRAFVILLKDVLFVLGVGLPSNLVERSGRYYFRVPAEGTIWDCKLVSSIWQYFMLANYSWILMEALYLHNLIFSALFSDRSSIKVYIILGWGLPLLCVIPWIVCRIYIEDDLCWTVNRNKIVFGIIFVPIAVSNIICFILFVILVWVILRKLRSSVCEETKIYRRLAKSTLVLIPLFGVHYVVFLGFHLYSEPESTTEMVALFINQLFTSFQGFFVALLYCFLNAEVGTELSKSCSWWSRRRGRAGGGRGGGAMNGVLGGGRLSAAHHRTSCYSRTSCTSLSLAANNNNGAAGRGKERDAGRARAAGSLHGLLGDAPSPCLPHAAGGYQRGVVSAKSQLSQDHRQSKTDLDAADTAIEMKPMTH